MAKASIIAFGIVAACAITGVDYINQSNASSLPLGQFPISDYIASVKERLGGTTEQAAADPAAIEEDTAPATKLIGGTSNCQTIGAMKRCSALPKPETGDAG
ncbi:MAG: hypothetical protein WAT77_14415 [Paracoccaceae bacterium]|jgi:hypothetical protein